MNTGFMEWRVYLSFVGIGIIVAQSQMALHFICWVGAAYLAWLACQALRSVWKGEYAQAALPPSAMKRRGFVQGLSLPHW